MARILFVVHTAGIGGPNYSLLMLIRYLRKQYHIAVLLPEEGVLSQSLAAEGIPYFIIPSLHIKTCLKIFRLIRHEGFDLIYGNCPNPCARNAMLAAKLASRPFIWHFHGPEWPWSWFDNFLLSGADAVITVSETSADALKHIYPREVKVVYNGVELADFGSDRLTSRRYLAEQIGLSPEAHYIISVSHLIPCKEYEQAVAIMAQLVRCKSDIHLVIAGSLDWDPDYVIRIRTLIQKKGLENQIHFLGLRRDIPQLLRGADVFLHTARQDTHPRSVLEAMAAGLPVVAFATGGITETVVHQKTGYLLPSDQIESMVNSILPLLEMPVQAAEMGHHGQQRIRDYFTAAGTAARIDQIIRRLL